MVDPVSVIYLPDGKNAREPSGFTGTGIDRITRGEYRDHWVLGDDGRVLEGDGSPYAPTVHILAPDFSSIVFSFGIGGDHSLQGVAVDTSGAEDTVWVATAQRGDVLRYSLDGAELSGDRISLGEIGLTPNANGLAYVQSDGTLLVSSISGRDVSRLARSSQGGFSLVDTYRLRHVPDHLHFHAPSGGFFYTYGRNGSNGMVRFFDVSTRQDLPAYGPLAQAQAIEGVYLDDERGSLIVVSDGGFHHQANPSKNIILKYRALP